MGSLSGGRGILRAKRTLGEIPIMTTQAYARVGAGSPVLEALQALLGDRVTTSMAVREHHGRGEDYFKPVPPDTVCFPLTTEEVAAIVKISPPPHNAALPFPTRPSPEGHLTPPPARTPNPPTRHH